jgi:hypothetical protein
VRKTSPTAATASQNVRFTPQERTSSVSKLMSAKCHLRRRQLVAQFRASGGHFGKCSERNENPATRWLCWQAAAKESLPNSLITEKIQGIFGESASKPGGSFVLSYIGQCVAAKFPTRENREFFRANRELGFRNQGTNRGRLSCTASRIMWSL